MPNFTRDDDDYDPPIGPPGYPREREVLPHYQTGRLAPQRRGTALLDDFVAYHGDRPPEPRRQNLRMTLFGVQLTPVNVVDRLPREITMREVASTALTNTLVQSLRIDRYDTVTGRSEPLFWTAQSCGVHRNSAYIMFELELDDAFVRSRSILHVVSLSDNRRLPAPYAEHIIIEFNSGPSVPAPVFPINDPLPEGLTMPKKARKPREQQEPPKKRLDLLMEDDDL